MSDKIVEHIRDYRSGEVVTIEYPICFICKLPVRSEHSQCRKQAKMQEIMAAAEWNRKQAEKLQKEHEDLERNRPKSQAELIHEKFVAEQIAFEKAAKKERRMQRIAELQDEIKHLTKLVNQDDANV